MFRSMFSTEVGVWSGVWSGLSALVRMLVVKSCLQDSESYGMETARDTLS